MDDLHRLLGEAVEVLALVGLPRSASASRAIAAASSGPDGTRHEQLVGLADVAAVGPALEHAVLPGTSSASSAARPSASSSREDALERARVGLRGVDHHRALRLVLEVGVQQAHRRRDARVQRDDHARDRQLACDVGAVQRAAAAERDEAEVARVEALLHAVDADRVDHVLGQDLRDAERRLGGVEAELRAEARDAPRAPASICSSRSPASRASAAHAPEHDLGVGRRRLGAAAAVADGSGVGARALRARPAAGRRRRRAPASRRRRRSCRGRPSAPSPRSRRGSCRRGASCARSRPARRRCRPTSRPRRA